MSARERRPLPDTRRSVTHRAQITSDQGPLSLFIIVGLYDDGTPGEIFLQAGKQGSTVRGLLDDFARSVSYLLQYGVGVADLTPRYGGSSYPPAGPTSNPDVPMCASLTDYVFRWLERQFGADAGDGDAEGQEAGG